MNTNEYVLIGGAVAAIAIVAAVVYELNQKSTQQSIQTAYNTVSSNPISRAAESSTIISGIQQQEQNSGLVGFSTLTPKLIYVNTASAAPDFQSLIAQSTANGGAPVYVVTPNSVSGYGGNPNYTPVTVQNGTGTYTDAWNFNSGWSGVGWYVNVPHQNAASPIRISSLKAYNELTASA